jgi:glutaminyl-tRNA synthetase
MPTLAGIRRRGFTPEGLRTFCAAIGTSRTNGTTDIEMLEHFQRDDLNRRASRAMAVLRPLKLVIDNYPVGQVENVEVQNNPEDPSAGTRQVPFSGEIYIDHDDFREIPPPKYYRLSPGKEVRLRNAYFITAHEVVKDTEGNIVEVHCTYDPASRGGNSPDGRKVKSTMHWVSSAHAISAEIRLYDKLFTKADPTDVEEGEDVLSNLNPNSLEVLLGAKLEPSLANAKLEDRFQFERVGYFCLDPDSTPGSLVFNRTLPLKDSWAKIEKKAGAPIEDIFEGTVLGSDREERKRKLNSQSDQQLLELRQHFLQCMAGNRQEKNYFKQYQDVLINEIEPILNLRGVHYRG